MATLARRAAGLRAGLFVCLVLVFAAGAHAGSFVELGGAARHVRAANFDASGLPDLAVRLDHAVVLLAAVKRGSYRELWRSHTAPSRLAVGDLDGDGDSDVAILDSTARSVVVVRTDPDSFRTRTLDTMDTTPSWATIADVNNDTIDDLLVVSHDSFGRIVLICLGQRDGGFISRRLVVEWSAYQLAVTDADKDGKPDLILTSWFDTTGVIAYRGNGDGTFQPGIHSGGESIVYPAAIEVGDLNGDGHVDLAMTAGMLNPYGHPGTSQVRFGIGSLRFRNWTSFQDGLFDPIAVAVGDLDRDGFDDVVYTGGSCGTLTLYRGRPEAALGSPECLPIGTALGPAILADLDLDGSLDVAGGRDAGLAIFWNAELRPTSTTRTTWTAVRGRYR